QNKEELARLITLENGKNTIEGLKHKTLPAFTVQYHPEASPGPEDANHLFDRFIDLIETTEKEGEAVCQNA
ncbi:glutamine amidotransferase-related protein, partial [Bacillus velezensis]